ncbi:MAG: indole-3-glycerol phosphate synthase TrpC [Polyangiaceae bacterium]|jgi:indole-3-glycerol phosphate synthase/phosphoribosylanthranilate isomerase|nr:indole-3-glycerol phosphate synthase TrpC [Polyangiaceae bacterium]
MTSVLDRIVTRTREDLAARKRDTPLSELRGRIQGPPRDFAAALLTQSLSLIAEIKPKSPSRGLIRPDAEPEQIARVYDRYANAISVLCDQPFFGGGYGLLERVRTQTNKPVLAKDFVVDPYQLFEARAHGADTVLLMVSVLEAGALADLLACARDLGMQPLVETHDPGELGVALRAQALVIGVNSRNLKTLQIDLPAAQDLLRRVPTDRVRVAESGLDHRDAVDAIRGIADAALIGTTLMSAPDPAARIEELGWRFR